MRSPIQSRLFLVGYPRSGTTLLQSLLAAHPKIASYPESHFFAKLIHPKRLYALLGIANPQAQETLLTFLREVNPVHRQHDLSNAFFVRQTVQEFVQILDQLTLQSGHSLWLEKTPRHLYSIKCIEKYIPKPKFIHIVRNGQDAIASLYDVTHKHPQEWSGARSIEQCLQRWLKDIKISLAHQHTPNHFIVRYEQLVAEPQAMLVDLCRFLNIEFSDTILQTYRSNSNQLILDWEPWKASVKEGIQNNRAKKFKTIFSDDQQQYILKNLSNIDMNTFNRQFSTVTCKETSAIHT